MSCLGTTCDGEVTELFCTASRRSHGDTSEVEGVTESGAMQINIVELENAVWRARIRRARRLYRKIRENASSDSGVTADADIMVEPHKR